VKFGFVQMTANFTGASGTFAFNGYLDGARALAAGQIMSASGTINVASSQ